MTAKMSAEKRKELSDRAKAQWAKRKAREAGEAEASTDAVAVTEPVAPALDPKEQVQCLFCGTYFERQNLALHQTYMHKGEMPAEEPSLPARARQLPAGAIVRAGASPGAPGIPMKVPWSRNVLEKGWECNDAGCRDPEKPGWRYIPEEGDNNPSCQRCGGPMHKLSQMVEYDAPPNVPRAITWQGLQYWLTPDAVNRVPDIIAGIARQSMDSDRRGRIPMIDMSPAGEGQVGRLRTTGLMGPVTEEEPVQAEV